MAIQTTIQERRTVRELETTSIPRETLYKLLEIASYAPFHSKQEPWHVTIIEDPNEKQHFLEQVLVSYQRTGVTSNYTEEQHEKLRQSYTSYYHDTPLHLLVTTDREDTEKKQLESVGATSAFIQNLQLSAWEEEIGVVWRTNPYIFDEEFGRAMGVPEDQKMIGSLHLGYPKRVPKKKERKSVESWTQTLNQVLGIE
ncbi:nitroreductase family protein [Jeotgalibacillus soli]|uniref:NAD(P)H nitroreductase n=1 Tax=Jeotgalibacillus soli TaxID=889306 RepID=A0A0C2VT02_9BACL|nr:nitroreductase [Jeotgalibacillus soli]KIL52037.1 NAD(P)H nitroreductase [Jeotgalibacillus soli]